jgi:hypothetical protein
LGVLLLKRVETRIEQKTRHTQHTVQRCSHLVRHGSQELGLGSRKLERSIASRLELSLVFKPIGLVAQLGEKNAFRSQRQRRQRYVDATRPALLLANHPIEAMGTLRIGDCFGGSET